MIIYIIKSSLCLVLLWGFYTLFLERENMHHLKRFYLLFSLIFAYTIPLITITYETDIVINPEEFQPNVTYAPVMNDPQVEESSINYLPIVLWSIYGTGFLIFAIRFIKNMYSLIKKVKQNENLKETSHINVLLNNTIVPHTFLKYIFVPKKEFREKAIPQEVLLHEKTHVRQKHTLDILCIEIFQMVFWFNPIWFWIKKSVRLNHEFLADQKVLKQQCSIHRYMDLLVSYPNSTNHTMLTSPINYSLTKKRIVMMSQKFSKTRATARMLLLLPILFGCVLLFNNKIVAQQKTSTTTIAPTHPDKNIKIKLSGEKINVNGINTDISGFAKVIDDVTKQWKDNELTEFHFDVKMENTTDTFLKKLNTAYRKTRLYKANPDGHDLVPPSPPSPEAIGVGAVSLPPAPPSAVKPPPPAKAPKVSQSVKNLKPVEVPLSNADIEADYSVIENEAEIVEEELEKARYEAEIAREESEIIAEQEIENAMEHAEEARALAMKHAEEAREEAEISRAIAMEAAGNAMHEAHRVRREAMEQAHEARAIAREEVRVKRERSHELREQALRRSERSRLKAEERALHRSKLAREEVKMVMKQAEKAREMAGYNAEKARKEAEKARKQVRKEANAAREKARKAVEKARKEREKIDKRKN
ncbi:M56 family metallopeptidase [Aquimarina algiphila]|uniref:M56 family metallopeptidase n=1 Tax=Aquimarina algiphila TaxID=2047982 RepID=UPI00232DFE54|nr:M56 family metallopeptidase [Aquimarina algiphila]